MLKKTALLILCLVLCLGVGAKWLEAALIPSAAGTTSIYEDQQKLNELKEKLNGIKNNKNNLEEQKEQTNINTQTLYEQKLMLEKEYTLLSSEVDTINGIISQYETIITSTAEERYRKIEELEKQLDDFSTVLVYMYKHGNDSKLEVFLKSKSYSEYLSYIKCMESILGSSDKLIDQINGTIDDITQKQHDYEEANKALVDYQAELEKAKEGLLAKDKELDDKLGENRDQIDFTDKEIEAMKAEEEALKKLIYELEQQIKDKLEASYDGKFSFPLVGYSSYRITSRFGVRTDGPFVQYEHHNGMDFACARGTAIRAVDAGTVTYSGDRGAFGNVVFISHGGGIVTIYAHCDTLLVNAGDRVMKDQVIARVGTTGQSSGYHLHFAVMKNGVYVDPEEYLPSYYTQGYYYTG